MTLRIIRIGSCLALALCLLGLFSSRIRYPGLSKSCLKATQAFASPVKAIKYAPKEKTYKKISPKGEKPSDTKAKTKKNLPQDIVEKNLFSPERKYEPTNGKEGKENPQVQQIKRQLLIYGIVEIEGKRSALVKVTKGFAEKMDVPTDSRGFTRIKEGDALGAYTVVKVEPQQVILKGDSGEIHLKLYAPEVKRRRFVPPPKVASPAHFISRKNTAFSKPTTAKRRINTPNKAFIKKVGTRGVPAHPTKTHPLRRSFPVHLKPPPSSSSQHPRGRPVGTSRYRR